jgi:hypothetical protein
MLKRHAKVLPFAEMNDSGDGFRAGSGLDAWALWGALRRSSRLFIAFMMENQRCEILHGSTVDSRLYAEHPG